MKVAVLDLGTNVFNMILCQFTLQGECKTIKEYKCAAKLGAGGLSSGLIAPMAFETAVAALEKIMGAINDAGGADIIIPYATSAVRDASNGLEFAKYLNSKFGFEIRIIPGEREAGPEPTKLPYEDGEGHGEADAPDEQAPVNYVPLQSVLTGPQREGHTGRDQLP